MELGWVEIESLMQITSGRKLPADLMSGEGVGSIGGRLPLCFSSFSLGGLQKTPLSYTRLTEEYTDDSPQRKLHVAPPIIFFSDKDHFIVDRDGGFVISTDKGHTDLSLITTPDAFDAFIKRVRRLELVSKGLCDAIIIFAPKRLFDSVSYIRLCGPSIVSATYRHDSKTGHIRVAFSGVTDRSK